MRLEHSFKPHTKINSIWNKDPNVRPGNIKLLEENIGRTLFDINRANIYIYFLDLSPKAKEIRGKINKSDVIKLKSYCTTRKPLTK